MKNDTMLFAFVVLLSYIQVSSALISWDSNCGVTKGCFPDCYGGCEFLVTWQDTGSSVDFVVQVEESDSNVYVATALSEDYRMGDDSVVGCLLPSTFQTGFNEGLEYETLSTSTLGLSSTSVTQSGGVITCTFTRDHAAADSRYFDSNNDYILMVVVGEVEGTKMEEHHSLPWSSDKKVDFNSNEIVGLYKWNGPLVKLHGIMMVLAWSLLSLIGMVVARYNKDMLPEKKLFGTKYWFQIHRGVMVAVVVFFIIGFIPIFVEIEGYSQIISPEISRAHPILGFIVTAMLVVNPIMGMLRPSPDHKLRWLFNWAHFGVGTGSQALAIVVMFLGYVLERSGLPTAAVIVAAIQIVVGLIIVVILEVLKWKNKKGPAVADMDSVNGSKGDFGMTEKPKENPPSPVPTYILIVFSILMFGFALGLLGIIAAA